MNNASDQTLDTALQKAAIHVADLPALELYIDQVITLIEQGYASTRRAPAEKPLTRMMINNYTKAGLVRPIKGKRYTKAHIVQMLIIYALKGTLSISDIKNVLDTLYDQPGFNSAALFEGYESALARQAQALAALEALLAESRLPEAETPADRFASLMAVCAMSDALSQLAGRMVAAYFAPPKSEKHKK